MKEKQSVQAICRGVRVVRECMDYFGWYVVYRLSAPIHSICIMKDKRTFVVKVRNVSITLK